MPTDKGKGPADPLGSYLMKNYDSKRLTMPKQRTPSDSPRPIEPGSTGSNEMPERDPTEQEILTTAAQIGVTGTFAPLPTPLPVSPYDDDADELPRSAPGGPHTSRSELQELQAKFDALKSQLEAQQAAAATGKATPEDNTAMLASAIAMLAQGLQGMQAAQLQGANTIAEMQRRTTMPENRTAPGISDYNPRGDKDFPRPVLKCEMFLPWPAEDGSGFTREELELLNLLEQGEYIIRTADNSKIKLTVTIETKLDSMEPVRLLINHDTAFNNYNHRQMPHNWLRQMCESKPGIKDRARAVLTMDDERLLIDAGQFNDGRQAAEGERLVSVGA